MHDECVCACVWIKNILTDIEYRKSTKGRPKEVRHLFSNVFFMGNVCVFTNLCVCFFYWLIWKYGTFIRIENVEWRMVTVTAFIHWFLTVFFAQNTICSVSDISFYYLMIKNVAKFRKWNRNEWNMNYWHSGLTVASLYRLWCFLHELLHKYWSLKRFVREFVPFNMQIKQFNRIGSHWISIIILNCETLIESNEVFMNSPVRWSQAKDMQACVKRMEGFTIDSQTI